MEAFYRFNTRIIAVIRVLSWAYYRFPENLAVPRGASTFSPFLSGT